jgi:hypothetical protein
MRNRLRGGFVESYFWGQELQLQMEEKLRGLIDLRAHRLCRSLGHLLLVLQLLKL